MPLILQPFESIVFVHHTQQQMCQDHPLYDDYPNFVLLIRDFLGQISNLT